MAVKQTKCPFCGCAFYITSLQLNAYRGQARCGQCHQVFDAASNMVDPNSSKDSIDDNAVSIPQELSENLSADTASVAQLEISSTTFPQQPEAIQPTIAQPATIDIQPIEVGHIEEQSLRFSDDQGLGHTDEEAVPTEVAKPDISLELGDSFDNQFLEHQLEQPDPLKQHNDNVEKLHDAADDSWIENLLNDEESNPKAATPASYIDSSEEKTADINPEIPIVLISATNTASIVNEHDEDLLSYLNRTGVTRASGRQDDDLLFTAEQKPAQHRILQPTAKPVDLGYIIGWGVMCAMMLGLLVAQYIYFNYEKLSFNPKTAVYVQKVCNIAQCKLPYMNKEQLHVKNIRLISSGSNQTTFKAKLVNSAHLSQPFPALKLSLKRHGKVVARQVIQPRQYLPENLKTFSRITTKTPYPVEFTIKHQKSDIEGYTLVAEYN